MTAVEQSRTPRLARQDRTGGPGRGGAARAWFAAAAVPLLVWQGTTLATWVARGHVQQITRYRDTSDISWPAAHVFEVVFGALNLALLVVVARGVVRRRRFTLDAMLYLGLLLSAWLDPAFMFYKQIFLYSSQFLNVRAWCGDMPGVLNAQCGQTAEPLVVPLLYADVLAVALLAGVVVRWVRGRCASWSVTRTVLTAGLVGAVFDMAMEIPVIRLGLWEYASGPDVLAPPGLHGDARYSLTTAFTFALITASVTALRVHRDDRGLSLLERGGTRRGGVDATAVLAVIAFVQLTVIASFVPAMVAAPYAGPWDHYPAHLTNGMCDNNATTTTPYPCR